MRIWPNRRLLSLIFAALSVLAMLPSTAQDAATRVWKDKSGNFRVEASLERVTKESATLRRKDDGRLIEVPLSKLSDSDVEFLRARAPEVATKTSPKKPTTAKTVEAAAQRRRFAIDALAVYDRFLADKDAPAIEKAEAAKARDRWATVATAKKIRVASKWYTPSEYRDLIGDELALIRTAYDFRSISDFETIDSRLKKASLGNAASIRADFNRGILYAFIGRPAEDTKERYVRRSAADAEDCFQKCIRRLLDYEVDLNEAERANLAVCYNNLAITLLRQRKYAEALRSWDRCLSIAPASNAVLHNIGQFDAIVAQSARGDLSGLRLTAEESSQLGRLTRALRGIPTAYDRTRGWRYLPLADAGIESDLSKSIKADVGSADSASDDLVLVGGGTGFVVSKGYVLTNRHVVAGDIAFKVRRDGEDNPAARPATVVAIADDPKLDLAILACDALDAPTVAFCDDELKLSTDVRTLGFPQSDVLGTNIKVTGGIVTALPPLRGLADPRIQDYVMHDAVINPGCSGGPLCEQHGLIVGINTAHIPDLRYSFAVTAHQASSFLKGKVPSLQVIHSREREAKDWRDVIETLRESTVQVLTFGKPDRYNPIIDSNQRQRQFDDRWCMACYGSRRLDCPERECRNGTVLTERRDVVVLDNGTTVTKRTPIRVTCPTCGGRAVVNCGYCGDGIDGRFR